MFKSKYLTKIAIYLPLATLLLCTLPEANIVYGQSSDACTREPWSLRCKCDKGDSGACTSLEGRGSTGSSSTHGSSSASSAESSTPGSQSSSGTSYSASRRRGRSSQSNSGSSRRQENTVQIQNSPQPSTDVVEFKPSPSSSNKPKSDACTREPDSPRCKKLDELATIADACKKDPKSAVCIACAQEPDGVLCKCQKGDALACEKFAEKMIKENQTGQAIGAECVKASNCSSQKCTAGKCAAPPPACCGQKADGVLCGHSDECRGSCSAMDPRTMLPVCQNQSKYCDITKCN